MLNLKTHPQYAIFTLEPTTAIWKELPDAKDLTERRGPPDGRNMAGRANSNHHLSLFDTQKRVWTPLASGRYLGAPHWSLEGSFLYYQDQLDDEESVFRANVASQRVERVFGFGEILRGSAAHCFFSGLDRDGSSLHVMLERGLTDIYEIG